MDTRRVHLTTPLDPDGIYIVVGTPKDGDGDPREAHRGSYDECSEYAERNESPDNYERYHVEQVIG